MFKIFFDSFKITNHSLILATPLAVFCSLFGLYYTYLTSETDSIHEQLFSIITMFVVISGLLGSWLYMVKKGLAFAKQVFLFDNERNKALLSLFSCLLKGFGRLFLPISGFIALNFLIYSLIFSGVAYLAITFPTLKTHLPTMWLIGLYITTFLTVLWIPEIVYNEKNALYALYNSVIKLFTQFKDTMSLYIFILALISAIIALLYFFLSIHPILSFLLVMLLYYIILYIVVLLFTYYERKFLKPEE